MKVLLIALLVAVLAVEAAPLTLSVDRSDRDLIRFTLHPSSEDGVWVGWLGLPPRAEIRDVTISTSGALRATAWEPPALWNGQPSVEVGRVGLLRFHRVCRLRICTATRGLDGRLTVPEQVTVRIALKGGEPGSPRRRPGFDSLLSSLLLNWDAAQHWVEETDVRDPPPPVPTPSIRVMIRDEGMYRLTYDDIAPILINQTIDPRTFGLWNRGALVPIAVYTSGPDSVWQSDDWIEFYAHGNWREDPQGRWTNVEGKYTRDNPYYLVWDQSEPPRFDEVEAASHPAETPAKYHWWTVHREVNNQPSVSGHEGAIDDEWYWGGIIYPGEVEKTFQISDLAENPLPGEIRARFLAVTDVEDVENDHEITLLVDDVPVAHALWGGFGPHLVEGSGVDVSSGTGMLTIQSTGDPVSGLRLDWFAIQYTRKYVMSGLQTAFAPSGDDAREYAIAGIPAGESVEVFDTARSLRLAGFDAQAHQDGVVRFNCAFHDTSSIWIVREGGWLGQGNLPASLSLVIGHETLADDSREGQYLVVYPSDWLEQAAGFRNLHLDRGDVESGAIAHVDHVFEEFSYGVRDPRALRWFLQWSLANWFTPPEFVLLLGDGTWDYNEYEGDWGSADLIPSYGNPASDNFFASLNDTSFYPDVYLGRIPAITGAQASNALEKVQNYLASPSLDIWRKRVLFVNGGGTQTDFSLFGSWTNAIYYGLVNQPPKLGAFVNISKDLEGFWQGIYNENIRAAVDSGCVVMNFFGHGATETWDYMLENQDTELLQNELRLPFVLSPTCFTGDFASPRDTVFAEHFLRLDSTQHGAIGFFGSSGTSYLWEGFYYAWAMFESMFTLNDPRIGVAASRAKLTSYNPGDPDSYSVTDSIMASVYNLLGDPLVAVVFPEAPDLHISASSITFNPPDPATGDSVTIAATVTNEGLSWESDVRVAFLDGEDELGSTMLIPNALERSVTFAWVAPGQPGNVTLRLVVDPESSVPDPDPSDNEVVFTLMLLNPRPIPRMPAADAMMPDTEIDLVVEPVWEGEYEFQVATTDTFGASVIASVGGLLAEEGFVTWSWAAPLSRAYCWHARVEGGAWSLPRWFTPGAASSGWAQSELGQLENLTFQNCEVAPSGAGLEEAVSTRDYAHLDEGASVVNVSSCNYNASAPENLIGGTVGNTDWGGSFYFHQQIQDPTVPQWAIIDLGEVRLIKEIASAHEGRAISKRSVWSYFAIETSLDNVDYDLWGATPDFADSGWGPWIPSSIAYEKPEPWPVRYIRFSYGRCYPFPPAYEGSRVYEVYAFQAIYPDSGMILTPVLGPAAAWNELASVGQIPEETDAVVRIELEAPDGTWYDGQDYQLGSTPSLEWIQPEDYPRARLRAILTSPDRDTSPRLTSWLVAYATIADLAVYQDTVLVTPSLPAPGETAEISAGIVNSGSEPVSDVAWELSAEQDDLQTLLASGSTAWLPPSGLVEAGAEWETTPGVTRFILAVDPDDLITESREDNNTAFGEARILGNLAWQDSVFVSPQYPAHGETVTISAVAVNNGVFALDETSAACFWADSSDSSYADLLALEPGASDTIVWALPVEPSAGQTSLFLVLDPDTLLMEVTRDDNELQVPVEIVQPADPAIQRVETYCTTPPPGDSLEVVLHLANFGGRDTEEFDLSAQDDHGWDAVKTVPSIAEDDSLSVPFLWPTGAIEDEYVLLFVIDPDSLIFDLDRSNNTAVLDIETRMLADLGLRSYSFQPADPVLGQDVELETVVRNRSIVDAEGFRVTLEAAGLTSDQQEIQSLAGQIDVILTWDVVFHEPGEQVLTVNVDADNEVEEACEEENRVEIETVILSPWDLAITSEDLQREDPGQEFVAWDSLAVIVSVRNVGDQIAPPATVALFDGMPETGGIRFSGEMVDSIQAGSADTIRAWWPADTTPGNHLLVGVVDPDTLLEEWNRENNMGVREITVRGDTIPPEVEVPPPWAGFQEGGYLSPEDTLQVRAWDEGSGIATITLSLDGADITAGFSPLPDTSAGVPGLVVPLPPPGGTGEHTLIATAVDQMGLSGSSVITYEIAGGLRVGSVAAFPSPASGPTWITAIASLPGDIRVEIYTPSGRLIRLLEGSARYAGRVGLEWDLLDQDGDRIANGVYLIRFILETVDSSESALGKLVVRK